MKRLSEFLCEASGYVSMDDRLKSFRDKLKKEFPAKNGWKFSVVRERGGMTYSFIVAIMQAPIDFVDGKVGYGRNMDAKGHQGLEYYGRYYDKNTDQYKALEKIEKIRFEEFGSDHGDDRDIQTDYFSTNYFYSLHLGKWDKPFVMVDPKMSPKDRKTQKTIDTFLKFNKLKPSDLPIHLVKGKVTDKDVIDNAMLAKGSYVFEISPYDNGVVVYEVKGSTVEEKTNTKYKDEKTMLSSVKTLINSIK